MLCGVTADSEGPTNGAVPTPRLVLCAVDAPLAEAWRAVADGRPGITVHPGSVFDLDVDAVISPANSHGWMRGGVDAQYAQVFPQVEQHVRSAVLALHGGELPVGEAVVVPTGASSPAWLISAPTMRVPGERLPVDTVHPYLAARAVLRLWRDGWMEDGTPVRSRVRSMAMPGLGTGVGGVDPRTCARQVAAAWDEVFGG
ncbi:O-acetyl-ADP-ribose deacetylase (regulator of RNase III), contains Macro domain [Streptoalloteichus tenebrarius]|uniref:O-acetyl-ADP-ribose deacetylase (Regulator of RNase III), contains Macro domain n=1 Tax=Streptoalloteichus tenebrarius (strain ATCC 17920 / DSM 40477 / JCM 4838 / CBS 697.72 / NBRC 16177 / NCIMB 11028 / NRRL B-12390 / A12253. 1 / ISP 5477) TaxID=1933 RepID=A0ABT1I4J0_STRSD|nr:macro domain-containing protein [Streptoalloteichus tenebrarius]MCP2262643.1 O-acetyl-ADP-ribose deacetylase (regulator of RNase III), contains Macro domain [Streptoalloteichus tenebrarius]BFF01828.1 macro domain-containing protein [Streptoalloteichus tenebrarius]